jgi:hypothetical protein
MPYRLQERIIQLSERLKEESPLTYLFDVVHYETIESDHLREHIDSNGYSHVQSYYECQKKLLKHFYKL